MASGNSLGGLYSLTNELFHLYSAPSFDLTVTSLPSLVCTVYGSLSKFGFSLPDVFVFFSKTRSPGTTGLSAAPCLLSACSLWVNLSFQSLSLTPLSNRLPAHLNSGSLVFNSLPNIRNAGVTPVLVCGVDIYASRNICSSSQQSFPST